MRLVLVSALSGLLVARSVAAPADFELSKEKTPAVHVAQGDVEGVFESSEGGAKYMAFYGIPYAKPPLGNLRFKDPEPAGPWEGVLRAHSEGNMCPQPNGASMPTTKYSSMVPPSVKTKITSMVKKFAALPNMAQYGAQYMMHMSEDCLFLNVYTPVPALPADALLPVLVFIHGGGFVLGSGGPMVYGPEYLMDKGVVLVTLNYRLGFFGFLSTNTTDVPGNAGLKDQRLALQWVRDNIRAFGGDPDRVTLYGESAGSYSVHMHVLSPSSKGLFHAAILSSSLGPDQYGFQEDPVRMTQRLGAALGADEETVRDPDKLVQFLRGLPFMAMFNGEKLMAAITSQDLRPLLGVLPFAVVVEPASSERPFLSRHPNDILRSGDFNKVPIMVGLNEKEGTLFYPFSFDESIQAIAADPGKLIPDKLYNRLDDTKRQEWLNKILDLYFKGQPISKATLPALINLFGDEAIIHGVHVGSRWHVKHATPEAPVYLYLLKLNSFGAISTLIGVDEDFKYAGHGDDLGYVFKINLLQGMDIPNKEGFEIGRSRMTELISNFVKEGKPTLGETAGVNWPAAAPGKDNYLEIGDELVVKENIFTERMAFWDGLFKEVVKDPIYDLP